VEKRSTKGHERRARRLPQGLYSCAFVAWAEEARNPGWREVARKRKLPRGSGSFLGGDVVQGIVLMRTSTPFEVR
jgi:hypothetical protein